MLLVRLTEKTRFGFLKVPEFKTFENNSRNAPSILFIIGCFINDPDYENSWENIRIMIIFKKSGFYQLFVQQLEKCTRGHHLSDISQSFQNTFFSPNSENFTETRVRKILFCSRICDTCHLFTLQSKKNRQNYIILRLLTHTYT